MQSADGADVLTFRPTKRLPDVVLSSPLLTRGSGYVVHVGGCSTGADQDGLYAGGIYAGGSQRTTFSVNGTQTAVTVN